jgi:hypothetical protein
MQWGELLMAFSVQACCHLLYTPMRLCDDAIMKFMFKISFVLPLCTSFLSAYWDADDLHDAYGVDYANTGIMMLVLLLLNVLWYKFVCE